MTTPEPKAILAARTRAGLTQREAGALIEHAERTWQDWELGRTAMHPALWLVFRLKVKHPNLEELL